jgi:DNA-directed RNA polymerase specialized sigma24 family protein
MALLAARLAPSADRDDIVQELLLKAWGGRSRFNGTLGDARGWLLTRPEPATTTTRPGPASTR